jgi:hypothetical protein
LRAWVDDAGVGTAVRLHGEQEIVGRVTCVELDAVHVEDARVGTVVLRPRHASLRGNDGTPISTWTICNVVVAGSILTIASDLSIQPDGSLHGTTAI